MHFEVTGICAGFPKPCERERLAEGKVEMEKGSLKIALHAPNARRSEEGRPAKSCMLGPSLLCVPGMQAVGKHSRSTGDLEEKMTRRSLLYISRWQKCTSLTIFENVGKHPQMLLEEYYL